MFALSLIGITASAQTDTTMHGDSVRHVFIAAQYNAVEFYSRTAVEPFFTRWHSDTVGRLVVAHFGDSHVQPGIFSGEVRNYMQSAKGFGGYGMMFPYSAAKTYSPIDYRTVHYGRWLLAKGLEPNPKLPLGVSGMTIRTYDSSAGFTLTFKEAVPSHYKRIRLYFKGGPASYDVRIMAAGKDIIVPASEKPEGVPFMEAMLPDSASALHLQVLKTAKGQSQFEFYGVSLESETGQGLVYHSLGVGGAPYTSVLKELLLDSQLPTLEPDLVILDFGTNDFLYSGKIPPDLDREIVRTIRRIRQLVPDVTILLTTTQDMDRHGANIAAAREFASLIRRIARMEGCALYDWYRISGGQYAMSKWVEERLARADHIHLTSDGYRLKGKLFTSALEQTLDAYFTEPGLDSLVLYNAKEDSVHADSMIQVAPRQAVTTVRHQIRSGESLSTIAERYGVKVSDIMRVNKLSSSHIMAGQYLMIEYDSTKSVTKKPAVPADTNATRYMVKRGDTLSEIAEKFHVSVKSIRKANGMKGSKIVEGKTLVIPKT